MNATGMKTIYPIGTQFIKQGRKRKDIETVATLGRINAVLIGTALLSSGDPGAKIAELSG